MLARSPVVTHSARPACGAPPSLLQSLQQAPPAPCAPAGAKPCRSSSPSSWQSSPPPPPAWWACASCACPCQTPCCCADGALSGVASFEVEELIGERLLRGWACTRSTGYARQGFRPADFDQSLCNIAHALGLSKGNATFHPAGPAEESRAQWRRPSLLAPVGALQCLIHLTFLLDSAFMFVWNGATHTVEHCLSQQ